MSLQATSVTVSRIGHADGREAGLHEVPPGLKIGQRLADFGLRRVGPAALQPVLDLRLRDRVREHRRAGRHPPGPKSPHQPVPPDCPRAGEPVSSPAMPIIRDMAFKTPDHSGPEDLDMAFAEAMRNPPPASVDLGAEPVDASGFTLVCRCGKDWAHEGRCARCGVRHGNLICGLPNNHRGRHQAIALWF